MTNQASREMKADAEYLSMQLELASRPSIRIGVVEFGATTRVLCRPTGDERSVLNCINRVNHRGGAELADVPDRISSLLLAPWSLRKPASPPISLRSGGETEK